MIGAGALGQSIRVQRLRICRSNELWQNGPESQVTTRKTEAFYLIKANAVVKRTFLHIVTSLCPGKCGTHSLFFL